MYKFIENFQRNKTEEILESFKKLNRFVDTTLVRKQTHVLVLSSEKTRPMFVKNLNILYARANLEASRGITPCLPLPEKRDGDILIGDLIQGSREFGPMYLPVDLLCRCLLLGSTGTGKSNTEWNIIKQLSEMNCNVLVFDRKKEAVNILNEIQIPILDAYDLKENLFQPPSPNINQRQWISKVLDFVTILGFVLEF